MELDGKSELPHDNDFIKEVASIRKPTDAIRVIAEATIREAAHEKCRGEVKEIAAEATESESVKEAIAKVNEFRDAIQEKAIEVAAAATPGGQALTAAMVAKEVASTVGKEIAKTAVKEVASQAVDATESESLQHIKGKIVETTTAVTEKGLDGAASRSGDAIDRIPPESPYPRILQTRATEVDIAKESTADAEVGTVEEREREVVESDENSGVADVESDADTGDTVERLEGDTQTTEKSFECGNETSNLNGDQVDDTTVNVDEIPPEGSMEELFEQIAMVDGDLSRLDDNGDLIKDPDGNLRPEIEFEVNGTRYTTDERGRITHAEGYLTDTPDNGRDNTAQSDAGGKDRRPGDDGGHLRARRNGGSSGNENLVPMRDTINRGDYAQSENEENQMLKEGKQVYEKIEVTYEDDSARPSKIDKTYTDGEKTVKLTVDNVEGSTDLLEEVEGEISGQDLSSLKDEIADMQADGNEVSVTSARREYDSEGNLRSVTVCITNETTAPREKNYKTCLPKA